MNGRERREIRDQIVAAKIALRSAPLAERPARQKALALLERLAEAD